MKSPTLFPGRCATPLMIWLVLSAGCSPTSPDDTPVAGDEIAAATARGALEAPSGLAATALSETRVGLTWVDNSTTENGFEVYRSTGGETAFEFRMRVPGNTEAFTDSSALPSTSYCFRVRATRSTGMKVSYSEYSNPACATTPLPPPQPPTVVDAVPYSSSTVRFSWTIAGMWPEGYRIERSLDGGASWMAVGSVPGSWSYFDDTGLTSEQPVCYRVTAYNVSGEATSSNIGCTVPIAAPTNLTGTRREDGAVEYRWSDNSAFETGYEVWYRWIEYDTDCDAGCYDAVYDELLVQLPANATEYTCWCAGVMVFVRATKDGGISDLSNMVLVPY